MNDERWRAPNGPWLQRARERSPDFVWELRMALKAAAIILSVVAAIVMFHG